MADYVSFRDAGFWHQNTVIEIWCSFVVEALDARPELAAQLADAREHWHLNATIGWNPVDLGLDDFCERSAPRGAALTVFEAAITALRSRDSIPRAELEARRIGGGGTQFLRDLPTADVVKLGAACALLLKGCVRPTRARRGMEDPWAKYFAGPDVPLPSELRRTPPDDWDDDARATMTIRARHALWQLTADAPGATEVAVRALEAALGARLPADYRELLATSNGSKGTLRSGAYVELWPIEVVLDVTRMHRQERSGIAHLVFFGGDGSRERLCFDTRAWPPAVRLLDFTFQTEDDSPWVRSSLSETIEHVDREGWFPS